MKIAHTTIVGNTRIKGSFSADSLEIFPYIVEKDEEDCGDFEEFRGIPNFEADEITLTWYLKVHQGALIRAQRIIGNAVQVTVEGTLVTDRLEGVTLHVGPRATIDCKEIVSVNSISIHRRATVRGILSQMIKDNAARAKNLLEESIVRPQVLYEIDHTWLVKAHELNGWECMAQSSSGNGCNYALVVYDHFCQERSLHYHYLPLRTPNPVNDVYEGSMRSALSYLTQTSGYEYP